MTKPSLHNPDVPLMESDQTFGSLLPKLVTLQQPVVFLGMMGAGKSTILRQFAVLTGLRGYDADREIEKQLGCSIAECFANQGEAAFRAVESQVIADITQRGASFLALGGGAFINPSLRELLLRKAVCVYLDVPIEMLWARLKGRIAKRPMLDTQNPRATFDALHAARAPIYAEAPIRVVVDTEDILDTVKMVKEALWVHIESTEA